MPTRPQRILLLDHHEDTLRSMWQYLVGHGMVVDCARSLDEAESLWNRSRYVVIVTDLKLRGIPESDGLKLVSYIHERCPSAHLWLLTTYGSPILEAEARRRGASGFLHRPAVAEERQRPGISPAIES